MKPLLIAASLLASHAAVAQVAPPAQDPTPSLEERLRRLEERLATQDAELQKLRQPSPAAADTKPKTSHWYDRLSIRGYGQIRYTSLLGENNTPDLNVPNDRSVNEPESLILRRGRVILFGDVAEHLYIYAQLDFAGSTGAADQALQMRDFYGDISLDAAKEYRFRVGTSKVPFGWVNLQSSQNRGPIERPDALNSAAEGERDLGAYFMWAPREIRDRFRDLVRSGRKGSGDYGVLAVGAFTGQGLNRSDTNGEVHTLARASWPFELPNHQVFEVGVQAYTGRFRPNTQAISGTTPAVNPRGVRDERVGVTAVWYPQPFGLEAEWNWGVGPQSSSDNTRITDEYLQGGYVQASWLQNGAGGAWFPFARWNYFDGSRKFARNAPSHNVNELDLGLEWSPWPEVEITVQYTHTFWRTDTTTAPYREARGDDRVGFQVQVNF
ncbi:MAG: porin [Planctomycetes bacterium]|nr:porin [Planctomycetota bacterium]